MTSPMFPPARHRREAPATPVVRRRAEEAFLRDHDGWGARALERLARRADRNDR